MAGPGGLRTDADPAIFAMLSATDRKKARGPAGQAALRLKVRKRSRRCLTNVTKHHLIVQEALTNKLKQSDNELLQGPLLRCVDMVHHFLVEAIEDVTAFNSLKARVKMVLMAPSSPMRLSMSSQGPRERFRGVTLSPNNLIPSAPSPAPPTLPLRPEQEAAIASAASAAASDDFTLPQFLLNRKSYVRSIANTASRSLEHLMVLKQDEMAKAKMAEERKTREANMEAMKKTFAIQLGEIAERKRIELEEREEAQRKRLALMKKLAEEEKEMKRQREEDQEATRRKLMAQVSEAEARKADAEARRMRESKMEKMRIEEELRVERERKEKELESARDAFRRYQKETEELMIEKAEQRRLQQIKEAEFNAECMRIMRAKEQAREDEVNERLRIQKAKFERGGGKALQASLEERIREDEEKMRRALDEEEQRTKKKLAKEAAKRAEDERQRLATLKIQVEFRETERKRQSEEALQRKMQLDYDVAMLKKEEAERKISEKKRQTEEVAEKKRALMEDSQRRSYLYTHTISEEHMSLHKSVLAGKNPGFINKMTNYIGK